MNNIPMIALRLKKEMERFLTTECDGDDVTPEEAAVYKSVQKTVNVIDEFLSTQQMTNRKFEVGKLYYSNNYRMLKVEKITANGNIKFKNAYGVSRVGRIDSNEFVRGVYDVDA